MKIRLTPIRDERPKEAVELISRLNEYDIELVEQPVALLILRTEIRDRPQLCTDHGR